ncbi:DUF294 nucleotidyltransferase-like domain-containing protein [Paenibacillus sp. YPG26]|uniref:DUF294 nucleotidyltransferase-like domain-containing protein n=1 Tax=Paenibacillus sp. YPG26 TaxID=2878915 RepID=UPI00203C680D|nr:DUF294 nucleotidyltransferase-like domain-containing protein [Paenibacillus sp. YPG26]USB32224.1 DUF294 nucleotidyltransferase-like domain-containing protein [Paenibacillus sp. YPG26]
MSEALVYENNYAGIRAASSPRTLRAERVKEQSCLWGNFGTMPIPEWSRAVNLMHDEVMIRAAYLAERVMEAEGIGAPPVPYAFVTFGSGGRAEQTLWSDQDNGLIIGEGGGERSGIYYKYFAGTLTKILEKAGYPPCPGNVMLTNPLWRRTLDGWQRQLKGWRDELQWEHVRYLNMASDMRFITGNRELAAEWKGIFQKVMEPSDRLTSALLRGTVRHKAGLNVLGQVITEPFGDHAGSFDIKYGLYMPLVNGLRCIALQYGIQETSTIERLRILIQMEAIPGHWLEACRHSFHSSLKLRSLASYSDHEGNPQGSPYLSPSIMKQKDVVRELRESLGAVKLLYRTLQRQLRFSERKGL